MSVKYFISYCFCTAEKNGKIGWGNAEIDYSKKIEGIVDINNIQDDFVSRHCLQTMSIMNFVELGGHYERCCTTQSF